MGNIPLEVKVELSGKLAATAHFNKVYPQVHASDQKKLYRVITNTREIEGRTKSFALKYPFVYNGRKFNSLRCKGISPQIKADGSLLPHRGAGYVSRAIEVSRSGEVYIRKGGFSPEGTMTEYYVRREFETASALGEDLTDLILGYGFYHGLAFKLNPEKKEEKIGFVIYAMEPKRDMRLYQDFLIRFFEPPSTIHRIFTEFGESLASMHRRGFVHRYLHFGNIGLNSGEDWRVVIRDLESAERLEDMSPQQKFGYLLLDIANVLTRDLPIIKRTKKGIFFSYFGSYRFAFLKGYTGRDASPSWDFDPLLTLSHASLRASKRTLDLVSWVKSDGNIPVVRFISQFLIDNYVPELKELDNSGRL